MEISEIIELFGKLSIKEDIGKVEMMDHLLKGANLAIDYSGNVDSIVFHQSWNPLEISLLIEHDIPEVGIDFAEQLEFIKEKLIPYFPSTFSKNFLAYVPSDPLPQSMVTAALTPFFNQFVGSTQGSPGGTAIESLVIKWIAKLLGLSSNSFGSFTSGGSVANLTGIYTGLIHQLEKEGINFKDDGLIGSKRPMIYLSDQTHNAIEKSILLLGLGTKSIHMIKTGSDFKLTKSLVESAIQSDLETYGDTIIPIMVVATAGTTNTGTIDDLNGIKELCEKYKLWYHIDGAYGAFSKLSKIPISSELNSITVCDSIALDCHKWLYTPFEAGIVLVNNHQFLKHAFELSAEYLMDSELENDIPLQRNFRSYGFPLTRELRGLKVWSTISSFGKNGLSNAITRDILKANLLRNLINLHSRFTLSHNDDLGVVCFTYNGNDEENEKIISLLQERQKYYISRTKLHGKQVFRACFLNRRSDLQTVYDLIGELDNIIELLDLKN